MIGEKTSYNQKTPGRIRSVIKMSTDVINRSLRGRQGIKKKYFLNENKFCGCFSALGVGNIEITEGRMNGTCRNILERKLHQSAHPLGLKPG